MERDRQSKIKSFRRQLPKLVNSQEEEQVVKHLEELEALLDRDDVCKLLQKDVLPEVIYDRIPWLYGVFLKNAENSKLCAFLADQLVQYPQMFQLLKKELEEEKASHEVTKRQKTVPKWILIIAIAVTGVATAGGVGATVYAYSQVQPYEQENQQLRDNLQANQVQIENLQAELKDLQQQVNANQKSVAQAKKVINELEDLRRKNVYLNNRLYRILQSAPCRIFSCYKF